jgi:hypothetical protein
MSFQPKSAPLKSEPPSMRNRAIGASSAERNIFHFLTA